MKKNITHYLISIVALILTGFMAGGCHYLDVDPELGITEEEVFST